MTQTILRVSPHRLSRAMAEAQEIAAWILKSGAPVTIEVRPVAEIDRLQKQVKTLAEALRFYANRTHIDDVLDTLSDPTFAGVGYYGEPRVEDGSRARAALKAVET